MSEYNQIHSLNYKKILVNAKKIDLNEIKLMQDRNIAIDWFFENIQKIINNSSITTEYKNKRQKPRKNGLQMRLLPIAKRESIHFMEKKTRKHDVKSI